jgi:three-Cys-motif partner protein
LSGKSEYQNASDGLPARLSGPWAEDKLAALSGYTHIVLRAVKRKWDGLCYIDLLAGGGKCILRGTNKEFDGSPLLALECNDPAFTTVVLVESDERLCSALRTRTEVAGGRATIIQGDCNAPDVIRQIRQVVPKRTLSIVFVDNLGLNVTFSAISMIVAGRAMDLVVTFQVSDLKRNARLALTSDTEAGRWDRFFGTQEWRTVIADFEAKRIMAPDLGTALADFYGDRLARLGYGVRGQMNRTMANTRGAPLYRVMLFSKHPLARKLFSVASRGSQGGLNFDG